MNKLRFCLHSGPLNITFFISRGCRTADVVERLSASYATHAICFLFYSSVRDTDAELRTMILGMLTLSVKTMFVF